MTLSLTSIPDDFGAGGANIGDGNPRLVTLLKEIQSILTTLDGTDTTLSTAVAALTAGAFSKRTVTVTHAGLAGASQVVNIGAVLPANAVVVAHELNVTEQFAGEADTAIILGGTDTDAIVASTDLDALAVGKYPGTLGAHPRGTFGGEQLKATFTATALDDLTAGSVTITVWFFVLA